MVAALVLGGCASPIDSGVGGLPEVTVISPTPMPTADPVRLTVVASDAASIAVLRERLAATGARLETTDFDPAARLLRNRSRFPRRAARAPAGIRVPDLGRIAT